MKFIQIIITLAFLILFGCKKEVKTEHKVIQQKRITANDISKNNKSISDDTSNNKEKALLQNRKYIYNKKINVNNVVYKKYKQKLKEKEEWYCNNNYLRFLPVLTKNDVNLILVPQDCGDFNYRFYLLIILNNEIISNLYVEGEWYEPGTSKKEYYEKTSFSIDSNYIIIVKKDIYNEEKIDNTIVNEYKLSSTGLLKKL